MEVIVKEYVPRMAEAFGRDYLGMAFREQPTRRRSKKWYPENIL
jgi:hypothetical protein